MEIRSATRKDYEAFYGCPPPVTMRAACAVDEHGRICGFGGLLIVDGLAFVFTDHTEKLSRKDMARGARIVIEMAKKVGVDVFAMSGEHGTTGLKHYGFRHVYDNYWKLEAD